MSVRAAVERLSTKFELEIKYKLGPDDKDDKQAMLLNRVITWTPEGIYWEADPWQIELVIAELGLVGGKSVSTCGDRPTADE